MTPSLLDVYYTYTYKYTYPTIENLQVGVCIIFE